MIENQDISIDGFYLVENGILDGAGINNKEIPVSGDKPKSGYLTYENNVLTNGCLTIGDYKVELTDKDATATKGECDKVYKKYADGYAIYFNPYDPENTDKSGKGCTPEEYAANTDASKTGNNIGCMKFYAFLDSNDSETVNLILDHNTTAKVAWNSVDEVDDSYTNTKGPSEADNQVLGKLKDDTKYWTGVKTPNPSSYTPSVMRNNAEPYTINYSNYNARLISAEEVAKITGADKEVTLGEKGWTLSSDSFYFGSLSKTYYFEQTPEQQKRQRKLGWLFDRTDANCTAKGCATDEEGDATNGYWTSSSDAHYDATAWSVECDGYLYIGDVENYDDFGVRPVITVSKSKLQ